MTPSAAARIEVTDLPAIDRHVVGEAVAAQSGAPERRRLHVLHVPACHDMVTVDRGRDRRLLDLGLPDAGRVHIGLVRQVHHVVDHQPVVAADVIRAAAMDPVGMAHGRRASRCSDRRSPSRVRENRRPDARRARCRATSANRDAGRSPRRRRRYGRSPSPRRRCDARTACRRSHRACKRRTTRS